MSASELGRAKLSRGERRMSIVSYAYDIMSASGLGRAKLVYYNIVQHQAAP